MMFAAVLPRTRAFARFGGALCSRDALHKFGGAPRPLRFSTAAAEAAAPEAAAPEMEKPPKPLVHTHASRFNVESAFTGMELIFLGTAAGGATLSRSSQSVALKLEATTWLFDCGEGTYRQMLASRLSFSAVEKIFVSHMHGDHIWGLQSMIVSQLQTDTGEDRRLDVYGPSGLYNYITATLKLSYVNLKKNATIVVHELFDEKEDAGHVRTHRNITRKILRPHKDESENVFWQLFDDPNYRVRAGRLSHSITCYGFAVDEQPKKIKVDAAKATQLGLRPGFLYKSLQRGEDVELPSGEIIRAKDCTFMPSPPRRVVVLSDCSRATKMLPLATKADLVVHETTYEDDLRDLADRGGHSTPLKAAAFATQAGAAHLLLTHFSSRYTAPTGAQTDPFSTDILVEQARKARRSPNAHAAYDLMSIMIPRGGYNYHGELDDGQKVPPVVAGDDSQKNNNDNRQRQQKQRRPPPQRGAQQQHRDKTGGANQAGDPINDGTRRSDEQ